MIVLYKTFLFWWKKNPLKASLCLGVCFTHVFLLHYLIQDLPVPEKKKQIPLVVRTLSPKIKTSLQPSSQKTTTPSQSPSQKIAPLPQPAKKTEKPKQKTTKPLEKKQPSKKPSPPSISSKKQQLIRESLQKIEKSIAEIEPKNAKLQPAPTLHVPAKVDIHLESIGDPSSQEGSAYVLALIDYLQENLQLQEGGEVKIQITLSETGKVKHLKILSSTSEKNKKRLEERLPNLHFPLPKRKSENTLILTFYNDL